MITEEYLRDDMEGDKPVESRLSAEEKQLFQAVLRVLDDRQYSLWAHPGQRVSGTSWAEASNAQLDAEVNKERLDFADAVIDTWRRFKAQQ